MNEMLKQAQQLQKDMEAAQHRLETEEIQVSSGGGAVTIKITGSSDFKEIKLSDELLKSDKATIEATLLAAAQEAVKSAKSTHEAQMRDVTAKLNFPGLGDDFPGLEELMGGEPSSGPTPKAKRAFDDIDRV